jgi:3-oxoacyl-[acyl-carrier protein] reductase
MRLKDKIAIVTGAARGIGAATAQQFAQEGAMVAVVDIDQSEADAVTAAIRASGGRAETFVCNVAQLAEVEALVAAVVERHKKLDILINNAGICPRISIEDMTEAMFDKIININLKSVFFLSRAAAEAMKPHGGHIVNLSSTGGRIGGVINATVYGATKAGILAMTKSFARHYARYNILVNAIAPGAVDTRMMHAMGDTPLQGVIDNAPLKRLAQPSEIASAIVFLASGESSWMTGATVDVNGGTLML